MSKKRITLMRMWTAQDGPWPEDKATPVLWTRQDGRDLIYGDIPLGDCVPLAVYFSQDSMEYYPGYYRVEEEPQP